MFRYGVFSGPYFPVLGPENTPYLDIFPAVLQICSNITGQTNVPTWSQLLNIKKKKVPKKLDKIFGSFAIILLTNITLTKLSKINKTIFSRIKKKHYQQKVTSRNGLFYLCFSKQKFHCFKVRNTLV